MGCKKQIRLMAIKRKKSSDDTSILSIKILGPMINNIGYYKKIEVMDQYYW
jgi:hypothetical protein